MLWTHEAQQTLELELCSELNLTYLVEHQSIGLDYKILAKVIVKRLEPVLPKLIYPDQTGFIKRFHFFF